jgi:hypothetical protein
MLQDYRRYVVSATYGDEKKPPKVQVLHLTGFVHGVPVYGPVLAVEPGPGVLERGAKAARILEQDETGGKKSSSVTDEDVVSVERARKEAP